MFTQDEVSIPIEIYNEQQGLRFLELSPALLEAITSSRRSSFFLKSSAPSVESRQQTSTAVLCTNNETYNIRQVHSSNSVFVLQPSETQDSGDANSIPVDSLSAIARCTATLELIPCSPSGTAILKERLALFTGRSLEGKEARMGALERKGEMSKAKIAEDAPLSIGQLETAWKTLCAFEAQATSWCPTAFALITIWQSIMSSVTLKSINLEQVFAVSALAATVEEDGLPSALLDAVLRRLARQGSDMMDGYALLDKTTCIAWVGEILLESLTSSSNGTPSTDFMHNWRELLPESWSAEVKLDILQGKYIQRSKTSIMFDNAPSKIEPKHTGTASASDGKPSRKWHEKFKNARE